MQTLNRNRAPYRPMARNFSGLMDLYELNYIRLRRLIPDAVGLGEHAVSVVSGGLDLHYQLLEQCRYTRTFTLTYCFAAQPCVVNDLSGQSRDAYRAPDLQIRMYQDARLAEVISGVLHRHYVHRDQPIVDSQLADPSMGAIMARWRLNRFLYRWLNFCLKQGHVFQPRAARLWETISGLD